METERMIIKNDQKMASQIDEEIAKFADSGRVAPWFGTFAKLLLGKISYPNNAGGVGSRRDSVGLLTWGAGIDGQALEGSTVE